MSPFREKPKKVGISPDQLAYIGMVRFALKGEGSIHSVLHQLGPADIDEIVEGREVGVMSEIMILALYPIDVVLARKLHPSVVEYVREGVRKRFIQGQELMRDLNELRPSRVGRHEPELPLRIRYRTVMKHLFIR